MAGDEAVAQFAQRTRNNSQQRRGDAPEPAQVLRNEDRSVRAGQQAFAGLAVVEDDVHGIEIGRADAMAAQNPGGEIALQRCEPEDVAVVALEDEFHGAIAEAADAVVENDRVGVVGQVVRLTS